MDDGGQRENGRHKAAQGQWLMQGQPSMKQIMAIIAERDAAMHESNVAIAEKKAAIAERDMAFLQRDSAIAERNNAIIERDNAIAALQYRETMSGCQISRGVKHSNLICEPSYSNKDAQGGEPSELEKSRKGKRSKDGDKIKKASLSKPMKKIKREDGDEDESCKQIVVYDCKGIAFDETTMPAPVCSCTGAYRQCYKWGNGGWQSSCCTTTISCHPLPPVPNKRHARVGGRKMSGSAYSKLLSRLAENGHDLSSPVDLKEHWAKHGTNRYITIK